MRLLVFILCFVFITSVHASAHSVSKVQIDLGDLHGDVLAVYNDHTVPGLKRSLVVYLKDKIKKHTLVRLAKKLFVPGYERTFMTYLLPGMRDGEGAWATSHFQPELKAVIQGLRVGERKQLEKTALSKVDNKTLGVWFAENSVLVASIRIYTRGRDVWLHLTYKDGSGTPEVVRAKKVTRGTRYTEQPSNGEHYLLRKDGILEVSDRDGVFALAELIWQPK